MSDMSDHTTLILLGEIKGTLEQFKGDTERRFDELKIVIKAANDRANVAEEKAEEAHEYAKGVINKAIYYSMGFAGAFTTILFAIKNKALAAIIGIH
jgi:hypothetical protein